LYKVSIDFSTPTLRLDALHFSIGEKNILNNISAQFAASKIHGLLGPNGSGKSSLLKISTPKKMNEERNGVSLVGRIFIIDENKTKGRLAGLKRRWAFFVLKSSSDDEF
jgi:ABC-type cobalamin/Fe3+-siderophores transport system ATPase subunit